MHGHQRKERNCLNCGAFVQGRFCQDCGQQNIEPKETFWGMVMHFFEDITHFDSKFFASLRYLMFRPGFLSKEYTEGRRTKYLHPIRMYVFTSTLFFILFFAIGFDELNIDNRINSGMMDRPTKDSIIRRLQTMPDTTGTNKKLVEILSNTRMFLDRAEVKKIIDSAYTPSGKHNIDELYNDLNEVQSGIALGGNLEHKISSIVKGEGADKRMNEFINYFLHKLPYALFISLPLIAFLLYLLYIRNKQLYFFHHGVFTVHVFIFNFIMLFILLLLIKYRSNAAIWDFLVPIASTWLMFYMLFAMKKYYGQGWIKTIIKFSVVSLVGLFLFMLIITMVLTLAIYLFH